MHTLSFSSVGLFASSVLLAATFACAEAQDDSTRTFQRSRTDSLPAPAPARHALTQQDQGSAKPALLNGVGWGFPGFLVGALIGASVAGNCAGEEECKLEGAFYGAAAGGTLGLALGVHHGNRCRGNFALDFLTGAAVWGAGIGIVSASDWDNTVSVISFITIPVAQLASTVAVERAVGRSRARSRGPTVCVLPLAGGAELRGSVSF